MLELLIPLLTNKIFLSIAGSLLAAFYIYYRGYSSGQNSEQQKQTEASQEQDSQIRKAEKDNQEIEGKKDDAIKEVDAATTITTLLSLWAKFQKTDGSDAKKNPKS